MAWLWASREEYENYVRPVIYREHKRFDHLMSYPWAMMEEIICNSSRLIEKHRDSIADLLNNNDDINNKKLINSLKEMVIILIDSGERLLFFHKRLALDSRSNSFLQDKDMIEHWDRYIQSERIFEEAARMCIVAEDLLDGYHTIAAEDGNFLITPMNIPKDILKDFNLAKNLFSVGFDEIGLLIASRGLENALRIVAENKRIEIQFKNNKLPAYEADMHDVIETLYRIRWRATKRRMISLETRNLLHYLRSIRNSSAHSYKGKSNAIISPRETAIIVAETARDIWKESSRPRARVDTKVIEKNW